MSSEGAKLMRVVWVGLKRLATQDMAPRASITRETYLLNARKMKIYRNKPFWSGTTFEVCWHCTSTWSRGHSLSQQIYDPRSNLISCQDLCPPVVSISSLGTTYNIPSPLLYLHRLSLPLVRYVYGSPYQKTELILSEMKKVITLHLSP